MDGFCQAFRQLVSDFDEGATAVPTAPDSAAELKAVLLHNYEVQLAATTGLRERLGALGDPAIPAGGRFAADLHALVADAIDGLAALGPRLQALPADDPEAFAAALEPLADDLEAAARSTGDLFVGLFQTVTPDLAAAFDQAPACGGLEALLQDTLDAST